MTDEIAKPTTNTLATPEVKPAMNQKKALLPKIKLSDRTIILLVVCALILGIAYGYKSVFIAATVDGSPISRLALIRQLEKDNGEAALNTIITEQLISAEAAKTGIVVAPTEIDAEITKITSQVEAQGMKLEDALASQGLTIEGVRKQLAIRKQLEKLLGDAVTVTDIDINAYLEETKIVAPQTMSEEEFRSKIKEQLSNQKFSKAADAWIDEARGKANIKYFVDYGKAPTAIPADDATNAL